MENREDHIDTNDYFPQGNTPQDHPMCRCQIMVFMPDVTKNLVQEYINKCKRSLIWIN